jgi:hypothetical protein
MRRTVAMLLVVASPLLLAVPVGAFEAGPAGPVLLPPAPAVIQAPAAPEPVTVAPPAAPAPAPMVHAPAVAEPAATAVAAPSAAPVAIRKLRAKPPTPAALSDAAYAARLQAELCRARAIFCGLDHGGRYPAR